MPYLQLPRAEEPRQIFAAGPAQAYYMEPPEAASRPFANRIVWSSDGSTLLVRRLVPPTSANPLAVAEARQSVGLHGMMKLRPRVQLVAWSRSGKSSRTLLDLDSAKATFDDIDPMPASDRALLLLSETPASANEASLPARESYVLISLSTGSMVRLWTGSGPDDSSTRVQLSPKRALGVILRGTSKTARTMSFFGPDGSPGPQLPLAPQTQFGFATDGGPGIGVIVTDKKGKKAYVFRRIDPKTGAIGPETVEDGFEDDRPVATAAGSGLLAPPAVSAASRPQEPLLTVTHVRAPRAQPGIYLHVRGGKPEELGLVSCDGELPSISPRNDAVAYIMGNGAYVRSLVKVDRNAYDAAMLEAEKQIAISTAKQVGTAMSIYAMDADDSFPMADQKNSVEPYIKDRAMLDKFVYTFGGGVPGQPGTEIGYVAGPGGRAVVYADGTVKWVPDGF